MKMAMAEVYEVATFYHHFDVVKEGDAPPPAITVRVCDSIACDMAGSRELLAALPALLGPDVRVLHAPCVGRCETAPVAVVGQNPVPHATAEKVAALVRGQRREAPAARWRARRIRISTSSRPATSTMPPTGNRADMSWRDPASPARESARRRRRGDGRLGPARPRRRRLSSGPQVEGGRGRAGAAADGDQHRRGRAGNVQGPLLPGARPAPLSRRRADRRLGGGYRRDLHLSSRRVSRLPRDSRAGNRGAAGESAVPDPAHPPAPRRGRLHLRRRIRDDRIDRRQARRAAPASALRRAGRPVRPADARTQHGDAALGARHPREGAGAGLPVTAGTAERACARSR